tara:strand:+ start:883 stop:1815 length:933 start_codon:yes stop_codon:yes gene_type:complete
MSENIKFTKVKNHQEIKEKWKNLFFDCFGPRDIPFDNWYEWYNEGYKNNCVYCIDNDGELVASYGLYPNTVSFKGHRYPGNLCHNVMTHPAWGGKGFFTQIGKFAIESENEAASPIIIGIPNENAIRGHLKVGWQELENIPFYEKTLLAQRKEAAEKMSKVEQFTPEHDEMIRAVHERYDFYIEKDHKYLNWRFNQRPGEEYEFFMLKDGTGYVITKKYHKEEKLHIVDYGCTPRSFSDILNFVEDKAFREDFSKINFWMTSAEDSVTCRIHGFNRSEDENRFILHSRQFDFSKEKMHNYHIVLGDNDVY